MEGKKKLNLEELRNIAGGTPEEAYAYLDTLCEKYGLSTNDYSALDSLMTPEELDTFSDLFLRGTKWDPSL